MSSRKYEYKVIRDEFEQDPLRPELTDQHVEEFLNKLGKEGWYCPNGILSYPVLFLVRDIDVS